MAIDYDKLREDLRDDSFAAYFGGGIGPAILDAFDAEDASDEELEEMARRQGFNLAKYEEDQL